MAISQLLMERYRCMWTRKLAPELKLRQRGEHQGRSRNVGVRELQVVQFGSLLRLAGHWVGIFLGDLARHGEHERGVLFRGPEQRGEGVGWNGEVYALGV